MMTIQELLHKLQAVLQTGEKDAKIPTYAFASDLMSDVLTLDQQGVLLVTGLSNPQTIRTAEMADIEIIIVARGKEVSSEMIALAEENQITILSSPFSLFRICGILNESGFKAIY